MTHPCHPAINSCPYRKQGRAFATQLPVIRCCPSAKAATLRRRGLADVESAANAANERMAMPVVLLVVGLIVFIGYPAIARILHGL